MWLPEFEDTFSHSIEYLHVTDVETDIHHATAESALCLYIASRGKS